MEIDIIKQTYVFSNYKSLSVRLGHISFEAMYMLNHILDYL